MQVIIINDFAHINGGVSQIALSSAIGLKERNHNVIVFAAVGPIMPQLLDANIRIVLTNQNEIAYEPKRYKALFQGIWNYYAQKKLYFLLNKFDKGNTIIHVHSWTKSLSSSIFRIAINRGFHVVCTLHDYFAVCPNGGFFDYIHEKLCYLSPLSLKCIFNNCDARCYSHKLWRVSRQIVQEKIGLIPKSLKNVITVSKFSSHIFAPYLHKNTINFTVPNFVDNIDRGRVDIKNNDKFLYIGRLAKEKGVIDFALAARYLSIKAIFIGSGYLEQDIKSLYPDALFTGWLSKYDVLKYMFQARALVFPSLCYETYGLVVAEASALGIPSIVSDRCAARDMVEDGITGLWFRGGDVEDLTRKLNSLNNPELVDQMGINAYNKYWSSPFTMNNHLNKLEACYNKILFSH